MLGIIPGFLEDLGEVPQDYVLRRKDTTKEFCKVKKRRGEVVNYKQRKFYIRFDQFWFEALDSSGRKVFSNNQNEFARRYGLNQGHISECLNGKRKTCKGWRFIR